MSARLSPRSIVETSKPIEHPIPEPFALDVWVRVIGWHGLFRCLGANRDGSLRLYGGAAGRLAHRSVFAEKCRLATRSEIRNAGKS